MSEARTVSAMRKDCVQQGKRPWPRWMANVRLNPIRMTGNAREIEFSAGNIAALGAANLHSGLRSG